MREYVEKGEWKTMIKAWITLLFNGNFFEKIYVLFAIGIVVSMFFYLKHFFKDGGQKRLDFILKAQEEGRCAPGKITCLTREGAKSSPYYCAEYMYVAEGKRYFVTYQINPVYVQDKSKDEFDADMLATDIKRYLMLYYDKNNPEKVYCKAEVFASNAVLTKTKTSKLNQHQYLYYK